MMPKNVKTHKKALTDDVLRKLGDLDYHLAAMTRLEAAVRALEQSIPGSSSGADPARDFYRESVAFLAACRTLRNYMYARADETGSRTWLDGRLGANLYRFHFGLINSEFHDRLVGLARSLHVDMLPQGLVMAPISFVYNSDELNPELAALHKSVQRRVGPGAPFGVVDLARQLHDGLAQIVKAGERSGKL